MRYLPIQENCGPFTETLALPGQLLTTMADTLLRWQMGDAAASHVRLPAREPPVSRTETIRLEASGPSSRERFERLCSVRGSEAVARQNSRAGRGGRVEKEWSALALV